MRRAAFSAIPIPKFLTSGQAIGNSRKQTKNKKKEKEKGWTSIFAKGRISQCSLATKACQALARETLEVPWCRHVHSTRALI